MVSVLLLPLYTLTSLYTAASELRTHHSWISPPSADGLCAEVGHGLVLSAPKLHCLSFKLKQAWERCLKLKNNFYFVFVQLQKSNLFIIDNLENREKLTKKMINNITTHKKTLLG